MARLIIEDLTIARYAGGLSRLSAEGESIGYSPGLDRCTRADERSWQEGMGMATGMARGGVARAVKGAVKGAVKSRVKSVEGRVSVKSLLALTSLLPGLIFVSGCAMGGSSFTAVTEIPAGKALVYLYRPRSLPFLGGPEYEVAVGEKRIVTLGAGDYYPYFARPGRVDFWGHTKAMTVLTAELKAGAVYYLRGGIQSDVGTKRPSFELVGEDVARGELAKCGLAETVVK